MLPLATVDDVTADWGELTHGDESKVETWIQQLSTRLRLLGRKRGIDIDALVSRDPLAKEGARDAIVAAIRRRLLNPDAIRQVSNSQTATPYGASTSTTLDSTISGANLKFLPEDLEWLPAKTRGRIQSFTVRSGY